MSSTSNRYLVHTALYVSLSLAFLGVGLWKDIVSLEVLGAFLIGGTFIPLPLDVYVLYLSPFFDVILLGLVAGVLNTVAVLAEWYFVVNLLEGGRGHKLKRVVQEATLSAWFRKFPFPTIFFTAFSPLPFEIFRFLAITNGYNLARYTLATFLGRTIRYVVLVAAGGWLYSYGWLGKAIGVGLVLYLLSLLDQDTLKALFSKDPDLETSEAPQPET